MMYNVVVCWQVSEMFAIISIVILSFLPDDKDRVWYSIPCHVHVPV